MGPGTQTIQMVQPKCDAFAIIEPTFVIAIRVCWQGVFVSFFAAAIALDGSNCSVMQLAQVFSIFGTQATLEEARSEG